MQNVLGKYPPLFFSSWAVHVSGLFFPETVFFGSNEAGLTVKLSLGLISEN